MQGSVGIPLQASSRLSCFIKTEVPIGRLQRLAPWQKSLQNSHSSTFQPRGFADRPWLQNMGPHPAQPASSPRVLSIQSHVVHGYVGNKCAVFPLQLLGFEVDPIYSVQFSNHTGYPSFKGARFDGEHLKSLIAGLEENGLMKGYTHLLSGYMGSVTVLEAIADVMQKMKAANDGHVTYVCDPVMGDEGKLYVAPELVQAYRNRIMPLASVLVPNQFEAELLAGCSSPITSLQGGLAACEALHAQGPHTVIITSMQLPEDTHHVTLLASTTQEQSAGEQFQRLALRIPKIDAYFTGTGVSSCLAWLCYIFAGECLILFQVACLSTHFSTSIEAVDLSGLVCVSLSINSHFWAECLWRKIALVARNYFPSLQRRGVGGL
uniref:pyridoxal kinase n=1 Tax=Dunaliella tertiolecta TaxID=3047 RepID=A0A7S3QUY8_DUNTE